VNDIPAGRRRRVFLDAALADCRNRFPAHFNPAIAASAMHGINAR